MGAANTSVAGQDAPPQTARNNLRQLYVFRTLAIIGQIVAISYVHGYLRMPLHIVPMAVVVLFLGVFNLATLWRFRLAPPVHDIELFAQIVVDMVGFSVLLYFTGGVTNPFVGMFVLPIAISAVMLNQSHTWGVAAIAGVCYLFLAFFNVPLVSADHHPVHDHAGIIEIGEAISFAITIPLIIYFVIRLTRILREREQLLAQAKENELNNERIVQMGAFAAGAAHALSTPLSTVAVVVNELQTNWHTPKLLDELRVISDQIEICKSTLSNLLASAGRTRMDGGGKMALDEFLEDLAADCQAMRPKTVVTRKWDGLRPVPEIIVDQSLRHALMNLLHNAADASPEQIDVEGRWDKRELCVRICDRGEGILPEAADKMGKGFFTSKPPGEGHGVGFMLSATIIRRFGGSINLFNQPGRGACTEVRLQLAPFLLSGAA